MWINLTVKSRTIEDESEHDWTEVAPGIEMYILRTSDDGRHVLLNVRRSL